MWFSIVLSFSALAAAVSAQFPDCVSGPVCAIGPPSVQQSLIAPFSLQKTRYATRTWILIAVLLQLVPVCLSRNPSQLTIQLVTIFTLPEKINNTQNSSPGVPRIGLPPYQWYAFLTLLTYPAIAILVFNTLDPAACPFLS